MDALTLLVLVLVGLVAGVINTLAGAGSLLTLPALLWAGVPPQAANASNRIGVVVGSVSATAHYLRTGALTPDQDRGVWGAACLGAAVGSWGAVDLDERTFGVVLVLAMWGALATVLFKPGAGLVETGVAAPPWARVLGFFGIGLYGGFLQAGVGYLLLAGFVSLCGHDLAGANPRKVGLVLAFTLPALLVFALHGLLWWGPGLALAAGTAVGGLIGARVNAQWGSRPIRWLLIWSVAASTGRVLGWW